MKKYAKFSITYLMCGFVLKSVMRCIVTFAENVFEMRLVILEI